MPEEPDKDKNLQDNSQGKETPPAKGEDKPIDWQAEAEKYKKEAEEYKSKYNTAEPVLKAVYGDPDAYKATNKAYLKMIGVSDTEDKKDEGKETLPAKTEVPKPSPTEVDNRNALISNSVRDFEREHGFDKLKKEEKETLNTAIIGELKGLLDPNDTGKSGAQLLEGVSVAKIPAILEKAYLLATRNQRESAIKDQTIKEFQNQERGLVGSMPSGSMDGSSEEITLSEKEKKIARRLGMKDDEYLANKKEIAKKNGSIY